MFFGAIAPFIIRPIPSTENNGKIYFRIFAGCYVIGFMKGEAIEDLATGMYTQKSLMLE